MSALDTLRTVLTALEDEGHALAADVRAVWEKLTADAETLKTEAEADLQQVEVDAAPVVAEAKTDAETLLTEAEVGMPEHHTIVITVEASGEVTPAADATQGEEPADG